MCIKDEAAGSAKWDISLSVQYKLLSIDIHTIILHGTVMTKKEKTEANFEEMDGIFYFTVYVYVKTVLIENVIIPETGKM